MDQDLSSIFDGDVYTTETKVAQVVLIALFVLFFILVVFVVVIHIWKLRSKKSSKLTANAKIFAFLLSIATLARAVATSGQFFFDIGPAHERTIWFILSVITDWFVLASYIECMILWDKVYSSFHKSGKGLVLLRTAGKNFSLHIAFGIILSLFAAADIALPFAFNRSPTLLSGIEYLGVIPVLIVFIIHEYLVYKSHSGNHTHSSNLQMSILRRVAFTCIIITLLIAVRGVTNILLFDNGLSVSIIVWWAFLCYRIGVDLLPLTLMLLVFVLSVKSRNLKSDEDRDSLLSLDS